MTPIGFEHETLRGAHPKVPNIHHQANPRGFVNNFGEKTCGSDGKKSRPDRE
jgi:hypothetical protein